MSLAVWLGAVRKCSAAVVACVAGARKGKGEGKSGARGKGKGSACSWPIVYFVFLVRRRTKNRHWFVFNYTPVIA